MSVAPSNLAHELALSDATPQTRARRGFWPRFARHRLAQIGGALLLLLLMSGALAPRLAPFSPSADVPSGLSALGEPARPGALADAKNPNGPRLLLGADPSGRDVWSRVLYGARISLLVGVFAMLNAVFIGTLVGLLGGFFGGWVDVLLTRITEIVMALPTILLAIVLAFVLPSEVGQLPPFLQSVWNNVIVRVLPADLAQLGLFKLLVVIGLVTWTGIARAVRGQVLSLKERPFVEAARGLGASNARILFKHLLPNTIPTIIVLASLATAQNILLEAGLSYLGLGLDPAAASWGRMISDGQPFFLSAPWTVVAPGVAIVCAVAAFNLLGQALEECIEAKR